MIKENTNQLINSANKKNKTMLPHPHPRTYIYYQEPTSWQIKNVNIKELQEVILSNLSKFQNYMVFDLDGTLFDVNHRTFAILEEWFANSEQLKSFSKELIELGKGITVNHMGYSVKHAFENLGIDITTPEGQKLLSITEHNWRKKFFDSYSALEHDLPYPGVIEFFKWLTYNQIKPLYLSGRFSKVMEKTTLAQLIRWGLPVAPRSLHLKPDSELDDQIFKSTTLKRLSRHHNIIASFENEYSNAASMLEFCPEIIQVIVDNPHSEKEIPHCNALVYRIKNFLD